MNNNPTELEKVIEQKYGDKIMYLKTKEQEPSRKTSEFEKAYWDKVATVSESNYRFLPEKLNFRTCLSKALRYKITENEVLVWLMVMSVLHSKLEDHTAKYTPDRSAIQISFEVAKISTYLRVSRIEDSLSLLELEGLLKRGENTLYIPAYFVF